jgi:hypothetical protein
MKNLPINYVIQRLQEIGETELASALSGVRCNTCRGQRDPRCGPAALCPECRDTGIPSKPQRATANAMAEAKAAQRDIFVKHGIRLGGGWIKEP